MNPGDPNQISTELVLYVLGMYAAAIAGTISSTPSESENVNISAKDVIDHMIERAKEWPIIMVMLIELRFAELTFMLHESEKNGGDVDLYLTVKKFLIRLYAGTHCTKYISLLTDFFVEWFCCSDAERIFFTKAVFTRKTKNSESIFTVSSYDEYDGTKDSTE